MVTPPLLQNTPGKTDLHYKLNNASNKKLQYSQITADGSRVASTVSKDCYLTEQVGKIAVQEKATT